MKVIGTSAAGNPMIELEPADRQTILAAGALLSRFPVIQVEGPLPADAVVIQTVAKPTPKAKPIQAPQPVGKTKVCKICGKPFAAKCSAKTCSPECAKENDRRHKLAHARQQGGKLGFRKCVTCGVQFKVKHADQQYCSDSCRPKVDKSARLAALKDAAARVGIKARDPLTEVDRIARDIEREERSNG
jgi:predicted nucleic acid-binding Zn ribbon protein